MVEKENPRQLEVKEYYVAEDKTPITVNTYKDGGYDFKEAGKRPSKGMPWHFEKSEEENTFFQSRGPALTEHADITTLWEKHEISRGMVRMALDVCKETYVGSYSKKPHAPLSDEEWLAGKPEPDPREGMSKTNVYGHLTIILSCYSLV